MPAALSVLDPSPVFAGRRAADALNETRALAEAVDGMAYRAYWVQEHHNAASFAGTAPEVMMADLAARTRRLRIGSGGIMLPNYSPLKVAELAATLSALYPDRIEIGLGRATGADPRASAALLGPGAQAFPQMLRMLMDWVLDSEGSVPLPDTHRARGIAANPAGQRPDLWMLCSSADSAAFAGAMGLRLAFADFLNPGGAGDALAAYRQAFTPSPFAAKPYAAIGLVALAAETEEEADALSATMAAWALKRGRGQFALYDSAAASRAYLETAPLQAPSRVITGTGPGVAARLHRLATETGANEFLILTVADSLEARIASYHHLSEAWTAQSASAAR